MPPSLWLSASANRRAKSELERTAPCGFFPPSSPPSSSLWDQYLMLNSRSYLSFARLQQQTFLQWLKPLMISPIFIFQTTSNNF